MKTNSTIDFVDNATTKEAAVYTVRYAYVFFRNIWRGTNNFAHRLPWVLVGLVLLVSVMVSMICVSSARIERDNSRKKQYQLQQVEQLSCTLETKRRHNNEKNY